MLFSGGHVFIGSQAQTAGTARLCNPPPARQVKRSEEKAAQARAARVHQVHQRQAPSQTKQAVIPSTLHVSSSM
eukprot:1138248-Pelagomonas_calceolata.AAC.7